MLQFLPLRHDDCFSETCMLIWLCLQKDICLLHEIEDIVGKQLEAYECSDKEVNKNITKVHTSS
jgi:hypothetical protein